MLDLAVNGYTAEQVIDVLHGRSGSRGKVTFRYDLLSKEDVKLGELQAQPGRVTLNSLAEIKRTASFELTEQEAQDVDWLNDRIRPVFCLKMPEIRKTYIAWGKIDASFSRSSIAYLSNGRQVPANTPRFEAGKFGKAVMVEEGTTNLLANPSFETGNFTNWYLFAGYGGATYEVTSEKTWHGSYSVKITADGTASGNVGISQGIASATAGVTYTFSVKLAGTLGANKVYLAFRWQTADNTIIKDDNFYISEVMPQAFKTYSATATAPENTAKMEVHVRIVKDAVGVLYVDAAQLEQKLYATSFIDGTRAAEELTTTLHDKIDVTDQWTIECRLKPNLFQFAFMGIGSRAAAWQLGEYYQANKTNVVLWRNHNSPAYNIELAVMNNQYYSTLVYKRIILTEEDWENFPYIVIRYDGTGFKFDVFAISGHYSETINATIDYPVDDIVRIGSTGRIVTNWNGLIDDLRISNRARSDDEILAAYQSGQPAPVDEWTTAKFDFDNRLTGEYFTIINDSKPVQWIEWPLGVFLLSSPTRKDENRQVRRSIEAYDSSLILKEDKFTDRYVIEAGTKYTDAIIDILNDAGIWKINIIDHPGTLATDREFEIGTTKLFAVNELLAAINYTSLWVDENGYFVAQPYVLPSNRDPEYEYRTGDLSIIHPGAEEELDLFAVPNKWVRYVSNPDRNIVLRSEYINDLSASPTSTINRGRTIVDIDYVEDIYDQATLDEYVKRIAYNASQVYGKFEFATALMPHHSYYNCLFIEYDGLGIAHKYMESSWSMDLHANGVMRHSCRRVIQV